MDLRAILTTVLTGRNFEFLFIRKLRRGREGLGVVVN